jgi:NhaA family Na+:H+ antiporter
MQEVLISDKSLKMRHRIFTPIREFLADSRAGGVILIFCTILSLILANLSATGTAYTEFWQRSIISSTVHLPGSPLLWINDVFMSFFFFLVAMEIKRELTIGELASVKKSMLPVLGALGGMIVPALIFTIFNGNTSFRHGWGIPMATDIAFSLGVLSLCGKRVPVQLKIFLAALAIIDDLGAVITIALFYTAKLNFMFLSLAGACGISLYLLKRFKIDRLIFYFVIGTALWYCLFNSGIHATIAGVIMAFSMPLSRLSKLEHYLAKPVTFFIMPLFALANTAIVLPSHVGNLFSSTISLGIIFGLVFGKPIGIFLFTFIATKLKIAALPSGSTYKQLLGMGILGGIGFTMSIFTSNLAFNQQIFLVISKVSIITASVIAALSGYVYVGRLNKVSAGKEVHHTTQISYSSPATNVVVG